MKSLLILFLFSFLVSGCDIRTIPIGGDYQRGEFSFTNNMSSEETWNKLLDVLQQKQIAIAHSDHSSGVITTSTISFLHSYTFESGEGQLRNPAAYVVCARLRGPATVSSSLEMQDVTGQWQFRIKKDSKGSTVIVALANAKAYFEGADVTHYSKKSVQNSDPALLAQSTGVFEKELRSVLQ